MRPGSVRKRRSACGRRCKRVMPSCGRRRRPRWRRRSRRRMPRPRRTCQTIARHRSGSSNRPPSGMPWEGRRAEEAARRAEAARLAAAAAAAESLRRAAQAREEAARAAEVPWWRKALDWVDEHQAAIALGVGVAVGVAAIALSGGTLTPLVAAAWVAGSTAVAGGVVAVGTVGLNAYYHRPLGTSLLRNVGLSAGAAFAVSGAGMAVRTGLASRAAYGTGDT